MKLPSKHTNTGRVLRAMYNAGPLTAGHIRRKAGLHPDTAVTARIRDLRKIGCVIQCHGLRWGDKTVYHYRLDWMPDWIRDELKAERKREIEMERAA